MSYRPKDIFYKQFTTNNVRAVAVNADSLPWATLTRNAVDDFTQKLFVTNVDIGRYTVSGIIPGTYPKGTTVGIVVSGYVNNNLFKSCVDVGPLDTLLVGDLVGIPVSVTGAAPANFITPNSVAPGVTVSVTGVFNTSISISGTPGVSGSLIADLRYINGMAIKTYQGIAQTGSPISITLATSEPSIDNYYQAQNIEIVDGKGAGQIGVVMSYSGFNRQAFIQTPYQSGQWLVIPDNTSAYMFDGLASVASAGFQSQLVKFN